MSRAAEEACYRLHELPTPWSIQKRKTKNTMARGARAPLLPGVDAVIVLTMNTRTGRRRIQKFMSSQGHIVSSLCPRAFFQINEGYRRCPKQNVDSPPTDLLHALLQAFRHAHGFQNVLIMEDDAIFERTGLQLKLALRRVGEFITDRQQRGKAFNTYNLGAVAHILLPCGKNLNHRRIVGFRGCMQAVIWSKEARNQVLESINLSKRPKHHLLHADDRNVIPQLEQHAFTYRSPVATQLFVETDNSRHWSAFRRDRGWRQDANKAMRAITRACIRLLDLDTYTQPGWNLMYGFGIGSTAFPILVIAFAYAAFSAASYRARRCTQ